MFRDFSEVLDCVFMAGANAVSNSVPMPYTITNDTNGVEHFRHSRPKNSGGGAIPACVALHCGPSTVTNAERRRFAGHRPVFYTSRPARALVTPSLSAQYDHPSASVHPNPQKTGRVKTVGHGLHDGIEEQHVTFEFAELSGPRIPAVRFVPGPPMRGNARRKAGGRSPSSSPW